LFLNALKDILPYLYHLLYQVIYHHIRLAVSAAAKNIECPRHVRHPHIARLPLGPHAEELSLLCPETSSGGGYKPFLNVVEPPLLGHHHAGLATPVPLRRVLWSSSPA